MVMTGAGPGSWKPQQGSRERSFGINIRLPFEDEATLTCPRSG